MTICPIAIAVGCKKCPAFKFCPLTTVLGDQEEKDEFAQRKVWEENPKESTANNDHINYPLNSNHNFLCAVTLFRDHLLYCFFRVLFLY